MRERTDILVLQSGTIVTSTERPPFEDEVAGRSAEENCPETRIQRVALASFVGTAVEWYDFFLYGTASALVFRKLFFPHFSPLPGTLASFASFGVGFIARPVGGILFGHFGDRVGRKSMLVVTLILMGAATFLIGLLPTFEQVGILSPLLLVVLRLVQGFAVGGEWGGATLMAVEHAPGKNRHFYASWPQLGVPAGFVLSTAVFAVFSSLPEKQFLAWGWRLPFLLSIVLVATGLFIRLQIKETPAFSQVKESGTTFRVPMLEVLRKYPSAASLATGVVFVNSSGHYLATVFGLLYLTEQLGVARGIVLTGLMLGSAISGAGILLLAHVADRLGRQAVAISSAAFLLLLSYPYFWLINSRQTALIWLALSLWGFAGGALYGVTGVLLAELFDVRVRYSGISLGYQMAGLLGGAPAPIIAALLLHWTRGASWSVATYLAASSLITLIAVCLVSFRHREPIHQSPG
jgi:MFS family permease